MIDNTLKSQIEWYDVDCTTAKDTIRNYEAYIRYFYDTRLSQVDNCICLDGEPIDMSLTVEKITEELYADLKIKKKTLIRTVIKAIAISHLTITSNNEDGSPISDKYIEEFNEIQENIENPDVILKSILTNVEKMPENDWDLYKKWKKNECLYTHDKYGYITGVDTCYNNIISWLENFPYTKKQIRWNNIRNIATWKGVPLTDKMLHQIMQMMNSYLSHGYSSLKGMYDAIIGCAIKNIYNPWTEYFDNLSYNTDRRDWIEFAIKEVLCCEEQDKYYDLYYETIKIMLLACMKRIYYKEMNRPVKYDIVTYFCSEQGSGKTTFFERLFDLDGDGNTYCYVVPGESFNPKDRDFLERTHQSVCVLLDEISMKRNMVTTVKGYITARSDKFRMPYGYNSEDRIRGFIITASSNNNDFLKDFTTENERRACIIKVTDDRNNNKKVNKAFDEGLMDKLWAQIKEIYDSGDYKLYIEPDSKLYDLETEIQRGYKASNNADYNTIIDDLLEREYGYVTNEFEQYMIDADYIVEQYKHGDSKSWCRIHNEEINQKRMDAAEGKYRMTPKDRLIFGYGKINRISKSRLYYILTKLDFTFTKATFNAEMRDSHRWNGWKRGNNVCRINGELVNAYWRMEEDELKPFRNDKSNMTQQDTNDQMHHITDGGLPF